MIGSKSINYFRPLLSIGYAPRAFNSILWAILKPKACFFFAQLMREMLTPQTFESFRALLPCVCIRYIRRQLIAVYDEMLINYRRKFIDILHKETEIGASNSHT